jgi:hypothetical protein
MRRIGPESPELKTSFGRPATSSRSWRATDLDAACKVWASISPQDDVNYVMTKSEIQKILSAETIYDCSTQPETGYDTVCACDMMSELLAIMNHSNGRNRGIILLTGLANPQVIRTSELVDIRLIVFLRDKKPAPETVELARKCGITIMSTPHTMYKSCGILHEMKLNDVRLEHDSD